MFSIHPISKFLVGEPIAKLLSFVDKPEIDLPIKHNPLKIALYKCRYTCTRKAKALLILFCPKFHSTLRTM